MYSCICMVSSIYDPYLKLLFSKKLKGEALAWDNSVYYLEHFKLDLFLSQ